jgi:serine/threonine protein kinase
MIYDRNKMKFVNYEDCFTNWRKGENLDENIEYELDEEGKNCKITNDLCGNLVGTAAYVAPEVLNGNEAEIGPAVDLWALGCIIYYFFHGETPFKDKTQLLMFDKILNQDIKLKEDLDEDIKDIISKLLVKNPQIRLGAGENGSKYDFTSLKNHPYFKGIDFDNLQTCEVPIDKSVFKIKAQTGTSRDCSFSPSLRSVFDERSPRNPNKNFSREPSLFKLNCSFSTEDKEQYNESIIKEGTCQKKSPWFHYNTRLVRLYSTPKIVYYEPKGTILKGTISLDYTCKAQMVDEYTFELLTKARTFVFKVL